MNVIFHSMSHSQSRHLYRILVTLHSVGLVHGDIAARNVILSPRGLLLLDFSSSSMGHHCAGEKSCYELRFAHSLLQLSSLFVLTRPLNDVCHIFLVAFSAYAVSVLVCGVNLIRVYH
jgi:hypothetical protein